MDTFKSIGGCFEGEVWRGPLVLRGDHPRLTAEIVRSAI